MKNLIIASLLAASVASVGARAMNYCSSGFIETNVIVDTATPRSTDHITDCQIATMVTVSYSSESAPDSRIAPAVMRVVGSTFAKDSKMMLIGKAAYSPAIDNTTALTITVRNNVFKEGAMMYVRGVFSPDTTLTIEGNTFDFGYPLTTLFPDPPGRTDDMSAAIYVHDLSLLTNAALTITGNRIVGDHNNTMGFVAINAVNFGGDVYLYGENAHVDVVDNDIDITCNATKSHGMAVNCTKQVYMYGAHTHFAIDRNRVRAVGSSSVFRHPDVAVLGSGYTSVSDNVVTADTRGMAPLEGDYRPSVVRVGLLNIGDKPVNTWIRNNTFDVTGPLASVGFEGDITCGDGCALYVADNRLTATGGNPALQFTQRVEMRGNAALWISHNSLTRTDATSAPAAPVQFVKSFRMAGTSTASVDGNTFSAAAPAMMVELGAAAQSTFSRGADARLYVCGNTFGGNAINTIDQVKAVTTQQIGAAAIADECIGTTTTIATTTLPETTAESTTVGSSVETIGNETTTTATGRPTAVPTAAGTTTAAAQQNKGAVTGVLAALAATAAALAAAMLQ